MNKKAIKTTTGEVLIGVILTNEDPTVKQLMKQGIRIAVDSSNAIYLKREKHVTFLDRDQIETIRDAHPWEKEASY